MPLHSSIEGEEVEMRRLREIFGARKSDLGVLRD
jgi:hypothetical protein